MTTLDRAIIKAYQEQNAVATTTPRDFARARPTVDAAVGPLPASANAPDDVPPELPAEVETFQEPASGTVAEADEAVRTGTDRPLSDLPSSEENSFRPMLQVDSLAWPRVCTGLRTPAKRQLDCLADALEAGVDREQKVVGISGCRLGQGCTTILLGAARRLARRDVRVALVDADLSDPRLARRLGLLPEVGWEEIVAGRLPLAEVLIESLEDRVVVLPFCEPPGAQHDAILDNRALVDAVKRLRRRYDLVLVDLGALEGETGNGGTPLKAAATWLDAAVLVHNVRSSSQEQRTVAEKSLDAAGITLAGIVENFVSA